MTEGKPHKGLKEEPSRQKESLVQDWEVRKDVGYIRGQSRWGKWEGEQCEMKFDK